MSIISQTFVVAAAAVTIVSLVAGVAAAGGVRRALALRVAVAVSTVVPAAVYVAVSDPFHSSIPWTFYVWVAIPLAAIPIGVAAWRRRGVLRRVVALTPVATGLLFAGANINAHYAYYPTLASLAGERAHDQVSMATLARIEATPVDTVPAHGLVSGVDIPGVRSRFDARPAVVYLPPAWQLSPRPTLPVLMLLAGTPGSPWDWTRAGYADLIADDFAAHHHGLAPILVVADPNGSWLSDTECVDGTRGNAETYLVKDVHDFVVRRFGAADAPRAWAIGGLSEGATCSLTLALRHPEVFGSFVDLSGGAGPSTGGDTAHDLFDGSKERVAQYDPVNLLAHRRYHHLGGWFESGTNDSIAHEATSKVVPRLIADGASVCVIERSGFHNFLFWRDAFRHVLPWVAAREGLVAESPSDACAAAQGSEHSATEVALTDR